MSFDLPDTATVVGTLTITSYIDADGSFKTGYDVDGISDEAAIGALVVVGDRIREEASSKWETCPDCGRPWSEHGDDRDQYPDDDGPYDQEEDE